MTYFCSHTLFNEVIQKSMEKLYLCFVEGVRVKINSWLADRNTVSLLGIYYFQDGASFMRATILHVAVSPSYSSNLSFQTNFCFDSAPKFPCTVIYNQLTGLS